MSCTSINTLLYGHALVFVLGVAVQLGPAKGRFSLLRVSMLVVPLPMLAGFSWTVSLRCVPCEPTYAMRASIPAGNSCSRAKFQLYSVGIMYLEEGSKEIACSGSGKAKVLGTGKEIGNGFTMPGPVQLMPCWQYGSLKGPGGERGPTWGLNGVRSTMRLLIIPVMRVS